MYFVDSGNGRIRQIAPDGIIRTIAGNGLAGYSGDGGLATEAELNSPSDVAVASDGTIYVADKNNSRVRKIDTDRVISTFAGTGQSDFSGDGGPASVAALSFPSGVGLDQNDALYVADRANNRIRMVDASGTIETIAGSVERGALGMGERRLGPG